MTVSAVLACAACEHSQAAPAPSPPPEVAVVAAVQRNVLVSSAEQEVVASNADIGVAKAAYFPQISLPVRSGFKARRWRGLFTGPAGFFAVGAGLVQPLFTAGKIRSHVALAAARRDEAVLRYRYTIQQSLREVSDSLVADRKAREFREQQELLTRSAQDAQRLADVRYRGGTAVNPFVTPRPRPNFCARSLV